MCRAAIGEEAQDAPGWVSGALSCDPTPATDLRVNIVESLPMPRGSVPFCKMGGHRKAVHVVAYM